MIIKNALLFLVSFVLVTFPSNSQTENEIVPLPDDLTNIPSKTFEPFLEIIGDTHLIGISEGTHGMSEPMDFRNKLIQFLVTEQRIDVVAIESGVLESRLVHDYINGGDGDLDTVLRYGIMPGFNELDHNRDLIEWMRKYNADPTNEHKVRFYGFDIPGVPSNPWNEEISIPFKTTLEYLKTVDAENWKALDERLRPYFEFLHINPPGEEDSPHFPDLSEEQKEELSDIVLDMMKLFAMNKEAYIAKSSEEDFDWGNRAMASTQWMNRFLLAFGKEPDKSYNEREQAMMDNLEWIMEREQGKNVLLFAHLAHLTKDFSMVDENGAPFREMHMFGEYLGEKFGEDYLVVANFFEELRYSDSSYPVSEASLEVQLSREDCNNYYMALDKSDNHFNQGWKYGLRSDGKHWYMNPVKGIDIVFFTKYQTEIPW